MSEDDILNDLSLMTFSVTDEKRLLSLVMDMENILGTVYSIASNYEILLMERLDEAVEGDIDIGEPAYLFIMERFSLYDVDFK